MRTEGPHEDEAADLQMLRAIRGITNAVTACRPAQATAKKKRRGEIIIARELVARSRWRGSLLYPLLHDGVAH